MRGSLPELFEDPDTRPAVPPEFVGDSASGLGQFDVVACSPPLAQQSPRELPGDLPPRLYRRDLANWLLAAARDHITADGLVIFHMADGIFVRKDGQELLAWLSKHGLHIRASVSVGSGAGAGTSVPTSLLVFGSTQQDRLFVGRFGPGQSAERLVDNLLSHRAGNVPETGIILEPAEFRGWSALQARLDLERRLRVSPAQIKTLSEVATSIEPLRLRKGEASTPVENGIYVYETSNRITLDPPDPPVREGSVFRAYSVALDPQRLSADFAAWWLTTELGQLSRQALNSGAFIPRISLDGVGRIRVIVPPLDDQIAALALNERLTALRGEVAAIHDELVGRPHAATVLGERLDAYWEDPHDACGAHGALQGAVGTCAPAAPRG